MLAQDLLLYGIKLLFGAYPSWPATLQGGRQRIYFANHTSNADTVVLLAALPREWRANLRPVAAKDYWGKGRVRQYVALTILKAVLIDRKREETRDPLVPLRAALDQGDSLVLFPEGQRNPGEEPAAFKPGLYKLAKEYPGVELVPVYLTNLHRIMPKGKFLPLPLLSHVKVGDPLQLGEGESKDAFLCRARNAVLTLKDVA